MPHCPCREEISFSDLTYIIAILPASHVIEIYPTYCKKINANNNDGD